jgi:hypothetical protein
VGQPPARRQFEYDPESCEAESEGVGAIEPAEDKEQADLEQAHRQFFAPLQSGLVNKALSVQYRGVRGGVRKPSRVIPGLAESPRTLRYAGISHNLSVSVQREARARHIRVCVPC